VVGGKTKVAHSSREMSACIVSIVVAIVAVVVAIVVVVFVASNTYQTLATSFS
jgi:ABC-type spermidine/putrescine transport system permease subunit II